jgi:hypothetical protein
LCDWQSQQRVNGAKTAQECMKDTEMRKITKHSRDMKAADANWRFAEVVHQERWLQEVTLS